MILPSIGWIVVLALAVHRAVRIICCDSISAPLRARFYDLVWIEPGSPEYQARFQLSLSKNPDDPPSPEHPLPRHGGAWTWAYELVRCPHCLGVWFAVAAYATWRWGEDVGHAVLAVLAVAGAQSALVSALPDDSVHTGDED